MYRKIWILCLKRKKKKKSEKLHRKNTIELFEKTAIVRHTVKQLDAFGSCVNARAILLRIILNINILTLLQKKKKNCSEICAYFHGNSIEVKNIPFIP